MSTPNKNNHLSQPGQYLTFEIRHQSYGIPIATVREINRMTDITVVPHTPAFVAGVMNLRGKVIPVVNLRLKFMLETTAHTRQTCIIVIEGEGGHVGMIVDSVTGVTHLVEAQIEPAPLMGEQDKLGFVMGMGKVDNTVIILVDIVQALSINELTGKQTPPCAAAA